jgi:hypothetical protein
MSVAAIERETRELVTGLLARGLAIDSNPTVVRGTAPNYRVTWTPNPGARPLVIPGEYGTYREYLRLLTDRQYTCLLADAALLQITYDFSDDEIVGHRLCYYPCPIDIREEDFESGDNLDAIIQFHMESEATSAIEESPEGDDEVEGAESEPEPPRPRIRLRSPIRFDYDPRSAGANHPVSHLHVIHEDCRWPVFGPLSIGHFVRFVLKHFYPHVQSNIPELETWPLRYGNRSITVEEEHELHISIRQA